MLPCQAIASPWTTLPTRDQYAYYVLSPDPANAHRVAAAAVTTFIRISCSQPKQAEIDD